MTPPVGDGAFARWLAARAGEMLCALRDEVGFDDPARLRDAGDKRAHDLLVSALRQWRPDDEVLSEEGVDDPARLTAERVWIVDPLDGTREFAEPGRVDWAVHVALWSRQVGLEAGAVALPAQHRILATDPRPPYPPLADPPAGRTAPPLRIAVSRSRPPAFVAEVAARLGAELVAMGSAGAKTAAVVTGAVDAYVHSGGQYEWDSAAPVAVALATGLYASRLDGSTLEYNRSDPFLPDLLVCRRDLAERLLTVVAECRQDRPEGA